MKTPPTPEALAAEFSRILREDYLNPQTMHYAVGLNSIEKDPSICHTHDYCDANQAMLDAMETLGVEFDPGCQTQADMMNAAWSIAKAKGFAA